MLELEEEEAEEAAGAAGGSPAAAAGLYYHDDDYPRDRGRRRLVYEDEYRDAGGSSYPYGRRGQACDTRESQLGGVYQQQRYEPPVQQQRSGTAEPSRPSIRYGPRVLVRAPASRLARGPELYSEDEDEAGSGVAGGGGAAGGGVGPGAWRQSGGELHQQAPPRPRRVVDQLLQLDSEEDEEEEDLSLPPQALSTPRSYHHHHQPPPHHHQHQPRDYREYELERGGRVAGGGGGGSQERAGAAAPLRGYRRHPLAHQDEYDYDPRQPPPPSSRDQLEPSSARGAERGSAAHQASSNVANNQVSADPLLI
ncbi:hypothetical protein TKK_0014952 [Trichogramma kaykai]